MPQGRGLVAWRKKDFAMSRIAFRNFTGGEVTPNISARYDLQKNGSFLQCCENFIPNLHGDIERRPGTRFVADVGAASVLIPFQFNTEPENNYVLIFQDGAIKVATADGLVDGVSMASPYALSDVYALSVAQVGDVVYLAHKKYALRKLTRSGTAPNYEWNISEVVLNQSLAAPGTPSARWHRGPKSSDSDEAYTQNENYVLNYVVTAVDSDGVESIASVAASVTGRYPTDWVQGDFVELDWNLVEGAKEYNVYRESAGYYGFIGVSDGTRHSRQIVHDAGQETEWTETQYWRFQDQNFEPDTATTPKENWNPFENGNNPATVAFHQQRMVLGGTRDNPASFYMSRTGAYENFRKSRPLQDDDPVEYMLASGSIDEIKWISSFGDLLIGTSGAEYTATSNGAAITSSDIQISVESYWGSSGLQPLIIGNSVLHCQRAGSHVRDLAYSWEKDGYSGNDLSLLAPQLVESHAIRQWCFQQSPGSCIWAVRDDGTLLCLTYLKEQNIFGWSRHVTQGKVLSVATISGEQEDVVMLVVEREIGGAKKYFLERLAGRFKDNDVVESAFFVDCGVTKTFEEAVTEVTGLSHLEGCAVSVLADGAPEMSHTVRDGKITLLYPAKIVTVGLGYTSVLCPMPAEADMQTGSSLGKRRAYGKCVLRLYRSVGGSYADSRNGDLFRPEAWQERSFYDLPFLPDKYGQACQPFSGDMEITLPSGQDNDTTIWIKQDRPMPFRLVAICADVDFGEV